MRKPLRKLIEVFAVLLLVSFGVFLLVALLPGDPAAAILGPGRPLEDYAKLRIELGLDLPLWQRYVDWLGGALTGDLGNSIVPPNFSVFERIKSALPVSVQLAVMGLLIALVMAIPLALISAYNEDRVIDRAIGAVVFGILSVPSFVMGLLLILITVTGLGWFPPGAMGAAG